MKIYSGLVAKLVIVGMKPCKYLPFIICLIEPGAEFKNHVGSILKKGVIIIINPDIGTYHLAPDKPVK